LILGFLPVPRQQFVEPGGGMVGDAGEHVGEPGLRVDVVELGRGDQRVYRRGALVPLRRSGKPARDLLQWTADADEGLFP
jgi:hypothetical protein